MDATNLIIGDEMNHQSEAHNSGEDDHIMAKQNKTSDSITENEVPNESTKTSELAVEGTIADNSTDTDEDGSTVQQEVAGLTIQKDSEVEEPTSAANSKKGPGREVTEKSARPKSIATLAKKNKDGKVGSVTSKQPLATATNRRSSNDRQISASTIGLDSKRPTKATPKPARLSQQTRMSSPATNIKDSIGVRIPDGGTKPQKTGGLPAYGFSFKCDERAQKRKEFYAKLEEKIHAKEVEKTSVLAQTQENREAEIKMFRKSLMFKATPMPTFYREPAPPKMELKKIPPTRAKSPKLSCSRSARTKDSDGNSSHSSQSSRFSLDAMKLTQNRVAKGSSPTHYKKPLRKSLPKLPSERTAVATATEDSASASQLSDQTKIHSGINAYPLANNLEEACLEKQ